MKIVNRGRIVLESGGIVRPSSCLYSNNKKSVLSLGRNTEIGNHSTISSVNEVIIKDDVLTGPHVFISDHNHEYRNIALPIWKQGVFAIEGSKVVIGEGSWIGTNAVIVGNVRVGKHCVIGANSVVVNDIPDYSVAVGIPAKVIKRYSFDFDKWIRV